MSVWLLVRKKAKLQIPHCFFPSVKHASSFPERRPADALCCDLSGISLPHCLLIVCSGWLFRGWAETWDLWQAVFLPIQNVSGPYNEMEGECGLHLQKPIYYYWTDHRGEKNKPNKSTRCNKWNNLPLLSLEMHAAVLANTFTNALVFPVF